MNLFPSSMPLNVPLDLELPKCAVRGVQSSGPFEASSPLETLRSLLLAQ